MSEESPIVPTIAAIAEAAGVSAMTVSRALRGNTRHSSSTRERIQQIAKAMGYRPNPMVSALMSARARSAKSGTTANLAILRLGHAGIVVEETSPTPLPDDFLTGICEQAQAQGYATEVFDIEEAGMSPAQLRRVFLHRGIRGIIVMPAPYSPFQLDFDLEGFAVAAIGFSVAHDRLHRVSSDAYLRTLTALRNLATRGYERIGLLNVPDMDQRFNFGMSAAAEIGNLVIEPKVSVSRCMLAGYNVGRISRANRRILSEWIREKKLQVIVSQMEDGYEALLKEGFKIPEEISYAHLQRHPDERVACMDQMFQLIGRKAADMVGAMINRNEYNLPEYPVVVNVPSVWRDGLTVPVLERKKRTR